MKRIAFGLGGVLLCLAALSAPRAVAGSSCVDCHRKAEVPSYIEHNFADWENSVHARAGVACETCHGGDPKAADKAKAHAGVIPSTMKTSPLYFTAVPESCGSCHQPELKAFKASAHYKQLQRTGLGPNCITCHGSMANRVLAPRDMELTCTLCHRSPTQAFVARLTLDEATAAVRRLEKASKLSKTAGGAAGPRERAYLDLSKKLREAAVDWHSFDMPKVTAAARDLRAKAEAALVQ